MLDADTQTNCLGLDASLELFFRRELPVSSRRRMAGKRFSITNVDETLDHTQRIIELHTRIKAAFDSEGQQR